MDNAFIPGLLMDRFKERLEKINDLDDFHITRQDIINEISQLPNDDDENTYFYLHLIYKYIKANRNIDKSFTEFYDDYARGLDKPISKIAVSKLMSALGAKTINKKRDNKVFKWYTVPCNILSNEMRKNYLASIGM